MTLPPNDQIHKEFNNNVISSFAKLRAFAKNENSIGNGELRRMAMECASALYHFRERLPPYEKRSRQYYTDYCPDYGLVGDIANAFKHHQLYRHSPQVASSDDIDEIFISIEYKDNEGAYSDNEAAVQVMLVDGTTRDVADLLMNVLNMWSFKLHSMGVIKEYKPFKKRRTQQPVSRLDARSPKLVCTQGVAAKITMQLLEFDYESNTVIPRRNVTKDAKVVFRAWKNPKLTVGFGDQTVDVEVPMTMKENEEFCSIESDEESTRYLLEAAKRTGALTRAFQEIQTEINKSQPCWIIDCIAFNIQP